MATQVNAPRAADTKQSSSTFSVSAVDPADIPEVMSRSQLEWWILFTIAVAGKTAKQIEKKMRAFFDLETRRLQDGDPIPPFTVVELMIQDGTLGRNLRKVKLGKYMLLNKGFRAAIRLDLDLLACADFPHALALLTAVPGLGPKGARMILMYAFPHHANQWVVLDVHILRWLRDHGVEDAPKATPSRGSNLQAIGASLQANR